ncbi:DegT/DnrJ/EryC1/StrS family aminotransferase, partial [Schleiferiaceae bacterium]|nr:DegT/DnrJ/EryC1/StrS family aminotransferase [Schleiferiaceae bacterium]
TVFWSAGFQKGDKILIPDYGFLAAYNAALRFGLEPILFPISEKTLCPIVEKTLSLISTEIKGIVLVYNYGIASPGYLEIINKAKAIGVEVIEDIAEAFYSKQNSQLLGTYGDYATCSFHATKTITSGEGGMVLFKNEEKFMRAKLFISHGLDRNSKLDYCHVLSGTNFRLSNVLASILAAELSEFDNNMKKRREIHERLISQNFRNFKSIAMYAGNELWAVPFLYTGKHDLSYVKELFQANNIEVRTGFIHPLSLNLDASKDFKVQVVEEKRIILPPSHIYLSSNQLKRVMDYLAYCD